MNVKVRKNRFTAFFLAASCLLGAVLTGHGQSLSLLVEDFDHQVPYSMTPSSLWDSCSLYTTAPRSMRGLLPQQAGDSSLLTSPTYDFSSCSHVYLVFDHICKISLEDLACIEIKEDYLGAKWHSILSSCYIGKEGAYRQQRFSDNSYPIWQEKLPEAVPDNRWWKTECFDLSGEAAFAKIQLRFKIKKGTGNSGRFAYGWLIDNIRLYAGNQALHPPVLHLCEPVYADKVQEIGPFRIAFRTEGVGLQATASYTIDGIPFSAKLIPGDSDTCCFTIPQTPYGHRFTYSISATDSDGNRCGLQRSFSNSLPEDGRDSNAAGIVRLLSPATHIVRTGEQLPLHILLKNTGICELQRARVCWSYHGTQAHTDWSGQLPADFCSDTLKLGTLLIAEKDDSLKLWIESANGQSLATADTLCYRLAACTDFLHGTYRIGGKDADFADAKSALQQLQHCGLSGNTVFAFDSGTYALHLNLQELNLREDSLTFTFTSASGRAEDVCWRADSSFSEIVRLEKVNNLCFRTLSFLIDSLHLQAGSALMLHDSCRNLRVENCRFLLHTDDAQGITSAGRKGSRGVDILGNTFSGGRMGVLIWGNITHDYRDFRVENNTFDGQTYCGLYLMAVDFSRIGENTFISSRKPTLGNRLYIGLELYGCYGRTVAQNRFRMYSGKYAMETGIVLPDSSRYLDIVNNEIYFHCTHAQSVGIMAGSSCRNLRFLHNTVLMDGSTSGNCCVFVSGISDSIHWEKNLWVHLSPESCAPRIWKFTQPVYPYLTGHYFADNHYWVPYGGLLQTDHLLKHLDEWQQLHSQDVEATEGEVLFTDTSCDLSLSAAYPLCFSSPEVPVDLKDTVRSRRLTTKGAHHNLGMQAHDAVALRLLSPTEKQQAADSLPLRAVIANAGAVPLQKVHIGWEWNGVSQSRTFRFAPLACGDSLHTEVLAFLHPAKGNNRLKLWTFLPNDSLDACTANDSLQTEYYLCDSALQGDYLVGTEPADFPDLESAVRKARHCGIRGPVRFLLASGSYPTRLNLEGKIPGSSAVNTLTISSLAGQADSVRLYRDSNADGQRAALRFSHTAHWNIEQLDICGSTDDQALYSIAVELTNSCSDIRIQHCRIRVQENGRTLSLGCGIYASETTGDSLYICQNSIEGGMYGVYLQGYSANSLLKNIDIIQNRFSRQEDFSMFLRWASFCEISGNTAENLCLQAVNGSYIRANRLHDSRHDHCLQLTEIGTSNPGSVLQISNNEIISSAPGPHCGMEIGPYCHDLCCLHNSISVIGNGEGKCLQLQDNPTLWNISFRNNLFYQASQSYDTSSIGWSELRSPSAYTFSGNAYAPLSFVDSSACLQLKEAADAVCLRLPEVPDDIDRHLRTALSCKGAYALPPCDTDACLTELVSPSEKAAYGSKQPVRVRFGNLGDSALQRLCFHWEVDGVRQDSVLWQGLLLRGDTASVLLCSLSLLRSSSLRIFIEHLPGDACAANDSLFRHLTVCDSGLSGELRIGQDYADLESALQALYRCGIKESVRITLPAGSYIGPFDFDRRVPGSDSLHRITITGEVADSSILTLDNSSQTGQAIIRCSHTADWSFENLCFVIPEKQQQACAVELRYDCERLRVSHCTFRLQEHSTATVYQHTNWGCDGFSFTHNLVEGGRYGLQLTATESQPNQGLCLCDNQFSRLIAGGIVLENGHFTEISRNILEQKASCSTGFYGIRLQSVSGKRMDANRVWASRGFYGLYFSQTVGDGQPLQVCNNEIHLNVPSSNCGIYLYDGCRQLSFCHNSVLLEGNGAGKCLYTAFNLYNITLKNNQFTNLSGKSSQTDNQVLYFYAANGFAGWQADYNHYYSVGQTIIYAGGNFSSMNAWQQQTGKEPHSNSFRPTYRNKSQSLLLGNYDSLSCPLLPEVTTDRKGVERNQPTQRGCYQATSSQPVDWELTALESPEVHSACPEAFQEVRVRLRNAGCDTLCLDTHPIWIRLILEGSIRMETRCCLQSGCLAPLHSESFTLLKNLALGQSGDYSLRLIVEDPDDPCPDNDSLQLDFHLQRNFLPYGSNMENAGETMTFTQVSGKAQWYTDSSSTDLPARCGKAKLCFPSASQRGSIAQASLGYLDLSGLQHPVLSVWYARNSLNKSETDCLRLLLAPEGDSLQEVAVLYRYKANCPQSVWERTDINLSAYAGRCVRIVWEGISYGGGNQYIDSLHLEGKPLLQLQLLSVPTAVHDCQPNAQGLRLRISNPSLQAVQEDSVYLQLQVRASQTLHYLQQFPLQLPAFAADSLQLDADFSWGNGQNYRISATLETEAGLLADSLDVRISTHADIAILQVERPPCRQSGEALSVTAILQNTGALDVYGIPLEILINDTLVASDTAALLRQGEKLEYRCGQKLYAPFSRDSLYALEVRIPLECDADFSNNSCFLRACLKQAEDSTAIVPAAEMQRQLRIYPNPSQGDAILLIHLEKEDNIQWEIINPEGQLLHRAQTEGRCGENRIRLPRLQRPGGLVFVRVRCGNSSWTEKWITL